MVAGEGRTGRFRCCRRTLGGRSVRHSFLLVRKDEREKGVLKREEHYKGCGGISAVENDSW